ncbi:MAG: DUF4019 domain-containing protein [Terriglobia bacterium]
MRNSLMVVTVIALCGISIAAKAQQKPEDLAQESAKQWLAVVDSGKYAQSWDEASQYLKSSITQDKWEQTLRKARADLGALKSRNLANAQYKKGLPNMPSAEYVVADYDSAFQSSGSVAETVFVMRDQDGKWRVAGYFVKSK